MLQLPARVAPERFAPIIAPAIETLADQLCQQVRDRQNPFEWIDIWVPHQGMASWLKHRITTQVGVAAQLRFNQPRTILWQMAQQLFPQRQLKLTQVELLLTLQSELEHWVQQDPELEILRYYLEGQSHYTLSLANACAQTFEDYLTYRPDWIRAFSTQEPGHLPCPTELGSSHQALWLAQHKLWQRLEMQVDPQQQRWHQATLQAEVLHALAQNTPLTPPERWPGQSQTPIQVFALHEDAPFYTQMLEALPTHIRVQRYQLDETALQTHRFSAPYWSAGLSETERSIAAPAAAQQTENADLFVGAMPDIQVHGCHHALREIEVLHDRIKQNGTPPDQVGVMVWNLEQYRPLIHGVFQSQHLPYSLLKNPQESLLVQSFEQLIQVHQGRLQREEVVNLLENEWIAQTFGFDRFSPEDLHKVLDQVDIRWGKNDFHRQQLGLPAFGQNSWESGLRRLILTYAMPDQGGYPYRTKNSLQLPEGQESPRLDILRALLRFFDDSQRYLNPLFKSHPLENWRQILHKILSQFFQRADVEELLPLREAIGRLPELVQHTQRLFSWSEVQALLTLCWSKQATHPFQHGRILIGTPEQLAGLPFQDLYMLGLNLGSVPGQAQQNDLNLRLQSPPRPAEMRRQAQDFRRFFRAMRGVRQRWILFYQSQHMRHQKQRPPAGILARMIKVFDLNVEHHALQAFDARYFTQDATFKGYYTLYQHCAKTLQAHPERELPPPFYQRPLTQVPPAPPGLLVQDFKRFFKHPAQRFLQQGLGIYYPRVEDALIPHEPFEVRGLDKYKVQQQALQAYIQYQGELKPFKQRIMSSGKLPVGQIGQWYLEQLLEELSPYYPLLEQLFGRDPMHLQREHPMPHPSHIPDHSTDQPHLLQGQYLCYTGVPELNKPLVLDWTPGSFKARRVLDLWVDHLFLQSTVPDEASGDPPHDVHLCALAKQAEAKTPAPALFYFDPLEPAVAQDYLSQLIQHYDQGQYLPLAFVPETSREFFKVYEKTADLYQAEKAARKTWEPDRSSQIPSESQDAAFAHCLDEEWFTTPEAHEMALNIWGPIERHLKHCLLKALVPEGSFALLESAHV